MKPPVLLAILALAGCEHHQQSDLGAPAPAPQGPIHVSWKLSRATDGKALDLAYEIENKGSAPVWVIDELVTTSNAGMVVLPDRVIVRRGPDAATASFVIGFTEQPGHAVEVQPAPVAHELAVGAKLSGTKKVPLPLAAWHPYDSMIDPLQGAPKRAVLEIGWLPKTPPDGIRGWADVPAASGGTLHLPTDRFARVSQQLARGDTLAIP